MNDTIRLHQREHLVEIVLNRPEKRNALHFEMLQSLGAAFDTVERLEGARAVILRGEGSAFSAGIDLTHFLQASEHFGDHWRDNLFPLTAAYQAVTHKIERCTLPVIAAIHGACLGLGMEIALACDFRIAAEGATLSLPETRIGIIPDVGGTARLVKLIGTARAKEYIMTGRRFPLDEAERWGLLNAVVPVDQLLARAEALASELAGAAPLAVAAAKRVIDGMTDLERGLALEAWAQSALIRSDDFLRGVEAALNKQTPVWKGN
jgi:enoyl-CoA hydratase/carnithine racemase